MSSMQRPNSTHLFVPAGLAGIVLLAYGVFIPWFGLYGDDWLYLHNFHTLGALSFPQFVAADRPFSGWIYVLVSPLFGEQAWPYHIFLLALRWLSAVLMWWIIRMLWPGRERTAALTAVLFAVYPGFQQHPIAVQYILHFSVLNLFLASLGWMLLAVKVQVGSGRRWLWFGLSLVAGAAAIFSMEYFAGLELLRPVMLWLALRMVGNSRASIGRVLKWWAPYVLVVALFAIWRVFIFQFPTYGPALIDGLTSAPVDTMVDLVRRMVTDLAKVNLVAWRQALALPGSGGSLMLFVGLVLASWAITFFFVSQVNDKEETAGAGSKPGLKFGQVQLAWPLPPILFGLVAMLVAGLPFWFAGVPLELSFPWDRSTLPFMFGVCLFLVGVVELIIRPGFQIGLLALVVAFSTGLQYRNAIIYQGERDALNAYFWQLAWRAPALQKGAIVASDAIPLFRFSDNDLRPILNWMYDPGAKTRQMQYEYYDLSLRLGADLATAEKDLPVYHSYRGYRFEGSSSNLLVVHNRPGGCLHILSSEDSWQPGLPETVQEVIPISNTGLIQPDGSNPARPPAVLGPEPEYDWCYYYEKASLAQQLGDWQTVTALGNEAETRGYAPDEYLELLPFIEGYARMGQWEQAYHLSDLVFGMHDLHNGLCQVWSRVEGAEAQSALDQYECQ